MNSGTAWGKRVAYPLAPLRREELAVHMSPSPSLPDDPHLADDISLPGGDDMANAPEPTGLTNAGQHVAGVVSGGVAQQPGSGERRTPGPDPEDAAENVTETS